ncbi:MAG: CRISPR-associated DxTHG motif protein [Candidatus Helarchaeota archaeon]
MATKLITFLGTNPYLECNYYFEDPIKEFYLTRFVQISDNSEILFLTTAAAKEQNWEDIKFENGEIRKGLKSELERLKNYLENKNKKLPKYHLVDIPEGKSESELWDIFNIITKIVDEDDEIYFDITHSFRSLPMFTFFPLITHVSSRGIKLFACDKGNNN